MIIDMQMPNMTGLELQYRLARSGIEIPTIVITAFDEPGARRQCIAAGAVGYLLKPLRSAVLIEAITKAIEISTQKWSQHEVVFDHFRDLRKRQVDTHRTSGYSQLSSGDVWRVHLDSRQIFEER